MAQPVTKDLIIAIRELKLVHGTNEAIANLMDISKVHVGQILAGKIETIQNGTWEKMYPVLRPYIERDFGNQQVNESSPPYGSSKTFFTPEQERRLRAIAKKSGMEFGDFLRKRADEIIEQFKPFIDDL